MSVTTLPAAAAALERESLHPALADPVLSSMNFLNEVMTRFPDAISFAPGAPHDSFLAEVDAGRHIESYLAHRRATAGPDAEYRLYRYGPAAGQINDLVARQLRLDEGIVAAPESIVVTVGCQEGMFITLRALHAGPDDVLIVPEPCYAGVVGAARLLGIPLRTVDQTDGTLDPEQITRVCAEIRAEGRRPRALYLVPDFANPSGARMDLAARRGLLALADEEDLLLLEDNPYGFTAAPGSELPTLKALDTARRVIYLGTYAKVCLPGARVGFVVADQEVRDAAGGTRTLAHELTAIKSMITVNTSPISQAVVGGILVEEGGSLRNLAHRKAAFYQRNLAALRTALDHHFPPALRRSSGVDWQVPEGGFFLMMTVPFEVDEELLEACARDHGVLWTPMRQFYVGSGGNRRLRLSFSYLDEARIHEGVARLAAFVRGRLVPAAQPDREAHPDHTAIPGHAAHPGHPASAGRPDVCRPSVRSSSVL